MINTNIAKALDMDVPTEEPLDSPLIVIEPHELPPEIDNESMPNIKDIDHSMVEGEKQLEYLISFGMGNIKKLMDELEGVDPKMKNRYLEMINIMMSNTLDAVKHKTDYQLKKIESRMKQKGFVADKGKSANITNNNVFVGNREEFLKMIEEQGEHIESD